MNKLYAIIQGRTMGKRFLGLLAIIIILWVLSCGLAINSMNNISNRSETTFETRVSKLDILDGINESFERSRNDSKLVYIASGSAEELSRVIPIYNETRSRLLTNLDEFNNWVNTWNGASDAEKTLTENTIKKINQAISAMDNIVMLCQNPETVDGVKSLMLSEDAIKINNDTSDAINELFTFYMNATNESNDYNIYRADKALRDISLVALAGITLAAFFFFVNVRSITIPVSELQVSLSQVANGNFNVNTSSNAKDEIGELTRDVGRVVSIFKKMSDDMLIMGREFEKGDIEYRVDDSSYTGVYKDVVTSINSLVDAIVSEVLSFIQCVGRYGDGDFTGNIPKLAGKKKVMNDAVDVLRNNLSGVSEDITYLVSHAQIGDLSVKADPNKYKGGWAHIISSLNNLLHSVEEPINEATSCISAMAEGDFKKHMQGDYKGSFNIIKVSLNKTLNTVGNYINEISEILDNIAHNNLNQELKRDYVGDFNSIKVSLNFIIETLNRFMRSIGDSSRQVASGSRHISDSSTEIAQGASVQSSSVEELTSTLSIIDRQTKSNATDAKEAHKLAMITGEHAQGGNAQMHQMLASMEEIKEASNSISKIIKVIQDIALQTNLLALNAAVEAAHAGSRGMGFAVVANEVRSLAAKSRKAAEDTELLIGDTISKIDSGTEIAVATAQSLETIIKGFDGVSSIVSRIADSSNEQVSSIENFAGNLNQISVIVNQNSATSEEAASASEELSSQSETLQNMLSVFNLRTDKN